MHAWYDDEYMHGAFKLHVSEIYRLYETENNKGVKIGLNHGSALDFFKDLNA